MKSPTDFGAPARIAPGFRRSPLSIFARAKVWRVSFHWHGKRCVFVGSEAFIRDFADALYSIAGMCGFDGPFLAPVSSGWGAERERMRVTLKAMSAPAGTGFGETLWSVLQVRLSHVGFDLPTKSQFRAGAV